MKKTILFFTISILTAFSAFAQKKGEGVEKIIFGSYSVGQIDLKEYMISKSGEVLFTARMDKQYMHIGHINKSELKDFLAYCNSKEWTDFIKFNPGKDYQYVRMYTGKEYVEMMWASDAGDAQMRELFTKLTYQVANFTLPEPVMAAKK
jgi:hypothetical protein